LPMIYMGSGNFTYWLELAGKGAGIKTAWGYGNASQAGMMPQIRAAGFKREDVFLETMIPCGGIDGGAEPMNASMAKVYLEQDLELLNTSYIDLLLLHHPCATPNETQIVWKVLEEAVAKGQAKAIGVSNFAAPDLKALLPAVKTPIAVNDAHFAVGVMDYETIALCNAHNISLVSFSSLSAGVPMTHSTITKIATKHNVSNAQIMLRFVSAHNISILSSFHKNSYAKEDMDIFAIDLRQESAHVKIASRSNVKIAQSC